VTDIDDKIVMRAHLKRSQVVLEAAAKAGVDAAALTALVASGEKKLGEQETLTKALAAAVAAAGSSEVGLYELNAGAS
jgi:cysteinyl-tRNA synthetase